MSDDIHAVNRYTLEELNFPVDGYYYIVKTLTSVDGGRTDYYCGHSRYFKTLEEARAYKAEKETENH